MRPRRTLGRSVLLTLCTATLMAIMGCEPHTEQVLTARMCLRDGADRDRFVSFLTAYARTQHLQMFDRSDDYQSEIEAIAKSKGQPPPRRGVISIALEREEPRFRIVVVSVSDFELQPSLDVMADKPSPRALTDARAVVTLLSERWPVDVLPNGKPIPLVAACIAPWPHE